MEKCPLCGESTNKPSTRLIKESCGHSKCRFCLINEESGCSVCEGTSGVSCRLESIGNFDYHLPDTTIPNYEELHSTPRKLDFNKIPDDFIDCPIDPVKLSLGNSINQNMDNVGANIPGPGKVDIGTETEKIVAEKDIQSQTVPQNTHSSSPQVIQTPMQPVVKVPEVFANNVNHTHQPHQETPVVQNANFIPVTQRADGRQFITIAFIANNSPNKTQQVVTPQLLNQCLPALTNLTGVQRPSGNQCIPMLGNISAVQNGNQIIIRSPNIVQNLMGNQSMPVIGNLSNIPNLPGNQSLSIVGNVNAVKNLVGNQSLPSLPINPMQVPTKGQSSPTATSPNVTQKVVGNHLHQVAQLVPEEVEEQSAPVQEDTNTGRRQVRARGLPRIKTVKNVNIVQNSATNQSDKVRISRQTVKSPVQGKGKRKRKELPVYLIPRKQTEQQKSSPMKSPPPLQAIGCMSPEYKLEEFVFFKRQLIAGETKDSEKQTETIDDTQMTKKPSMPVINDTSIISDQFNGTVIEDTFIENKVDIPEQQDKVPSEKTNEGVCTETDECTEQQDLSVVFNIREEENKQALNEKVEDETDKIKIPNGEASNKDEYQNLDALFDIIEKESKKMNGSMFDKEGKSDLDHILSQEDNIGGEKDRIINNGIDGEDNGNQHLNLVTDIQNKKMEIDCNNEKSRNSLEINYGQEQNMIEELPIQNGAIGNLDGEIGCKEDAHPSLDAEMKNHQGESEILDNVTNSPFLNDEVGNDEEIQSLNDKLVGLEQASENQINQDACLQEETNQHFDGGILTEEVDSNDIGVNNHENGSQCLNKKIDDEGTSNQTLYEDVSDEEKDSGKLNHENQQISSLTAENNYETVDNEHSSENIIEEGAVDQDEDTSVSLMREIEQLNENTLEVESQIPNRESVDQDDETKASLITHTELLNENTVEVESQLLNRELVDQNEATNQSLVIETHEEEIASTPSDTNNVLPTCEINDLDNSKLDGTSQKEERVVVKKPRGRPKKSLVTREQEQSIERDEGFVLETHTDEDEAMHENVNTSSTLAENENAQSAIKSRRERKKKSFSDYELVIKPKSSNKNEQLLCKKPRGRPKKSLSNVEQPNKPNDSQEIEQPGVRELSSFALKNNHKDNLDQSFEEEGQTLEVNVQIHSQQTNNDSVLNTHDKKESVNSVVKSTSVVKKPRGRPKTKNIPQNNQQETSQSDINAISSFVEEDESVTEKSDAINENEQSMVIKKPRGRPKKIPRGRPRKSLTNVEQHDESNGSQETEMSINDEDEILDREDFSQDETSQDLRFDMNGEEKDLTPSDKADSDLSKSIIVNGNEPPIVKKRGRKKKSLSISEQQIQFKVNDANVNEPTVIKNPRGRPKKSLSNVESNVSQDTEISNVGETINDEESKEQHERENETLQDPSVNVNDREQKESLHSNDITIPMNESNAENIVNESSMMIKKPRGRPKKSLTNSESNVSEVNVEPVIKKPRGRPKKSLSISEQQNLINPSQETETLNAHVSINDEESKERSEESQTLDREEFSQDETLQQSTLDMDNADKEIPVSNDTTNSDVTNTVNNESSIMTEALTNSEQPSQSDLSEVSVEPNVVKKSRGRPKKSLSNFEQQQLVSEETGLTSTTEISSSGDKVNEEVGEIQHETEVNQNLEESQDSIVNTNGGEKEENLHLDVVASLTTNESDDKMPNTTYLTDQVTITKIPSSKPKKSLISSEKEKPVEQAQTVVVKKSRGRPKKSLSGLEEPIVPTNSDLNVEDNREKDESQSFNGMVGEEEKTVLNRHDEKIQSLHTEDDESSILETAVNESSNQNSVDDKLETIHYSDQITIVKNARGRPKKEKPRQQPVEKKPRGRPKKANNEQQSESNVAVSKEHQTETKVPSLCTKDRQQQIETKQPSFRIETEEQQCLDKNRIFDNVDDVREESSQVEKPNEENEKGKVDNQEQENDFVQNEDVGEKVSTLSEENDESQTQQQNSTDVSNNDGEDVEVKDSQSLKAQDDGSKENKKGYSEKEEAMTENITPSIEEQDLENSTNVDGEVSKNSTAGRKYKKFDAINAQVVVESSKRKRKPKILLYENEDLEISPLRKKKKELNKSPCKNENKKSQVDSPTNSHEKKQNSQSVAVTVEKVNDKQENDKTASAGQVELSQNVDENSMDTEMNESNVSSTTISSSKDEDTKSMKRHRRPKTLLYENEDLKIKKKKVEFLLPADQDSMDSDNDIEKYDRVTEENKLETSTNEANKNERVRKPTTLLYQNEKLSLTSVKQKDIKSEIEKEDLMMMKKFEIKMEPIIVLERNIDLSIIKKYDPDDNSLHIVHERQETTQLKKPKSTVDGKKSRGRPKLSNGSSALKNKVLGSKHKKFQLNTEKRRPGRPTKEYPHIVKQPGEPNTYKCTICSKLFKHYSNKNLHSKCVSGLPNSTLKSYKCEFCPKKFYHKTHWEYHERMHKGDKPFRCDLCGKKFLQKGKLNRHLLIHKNMQDLECNECGKKFASKEYLKSHLLSHVESSFVFRCNQCPKSFTADSNRRRHELSHSPVALFTCLHCQKSFKTKFEVNKHTKIHQKARPFACDKCGKAFLTKFEVKRHTISHTGTTTTTTISLKE